MATPLVFRCEARFDSRRVTPGSEGSVTIGSPARQKALLVQPIGSHHGAQGCDGVAVRRLTCCRLRADANEEIRIDTLVFATQDWICKGAFIVQAIDQLFQQAVPLAVLPHGKILTSRLHLEGPVEPLPHASDGRLSDLAIAALARKDHAIHSLDGFANERECLQAFARILTILPAALRAKISFAAGFAEARLDALVQWVDTSMAAQAPSMKPKPTAHLAVDARGDDRRTDIARMLTAQFALDGTLSAPSGAVQGWRRTVRAALYGTADVRPAIRQDAALFIERFFERDREASEQATQSPYRPDRTITAIRDDDAMPMEHVAAISDSVAALEEILGLAKEISRELTWIPSLKLLARCAIGALRRIAIEKSRTDMLINAGFVRAMGQAPHCSRALAGMIGAGDREVQASLVQAGFASVPPFSRTCTAVVEPIGSEMPRRMISIVVLEPRGHRLPRSSVLRVVAADEAARFGAFDKTIADVPPTGLTSFPGPKTYSVRGVPK